MNRKERRANKRRDEPARRPNALAFGSAGLSIVDLAAEASRLYGAGRINQAQKICRQILVREPGHVQSLNLLGLMAQASGDHRAAVKMFARAIASDEVNAACHYNIGNSYQALGNRTKAIAHFRKALMLGMEEKAVTFILQSPVIATYVARIAGKRPLTVTNVELFGTESVIPLAKDLFFRCAMEATTLPSVQLEALLGYARAELLRLAGEQGKDNGEVDDDIVAFACAMARQCFINEYVYVQAGAESGLASVLLSTGNELSVRMGFQNSLGDGDYGSGISRVSGSSLVLPGRRPRRLGCGWFVSERERTFSGTRAACWRSR